MANSCYFSMRVTGNKAACEEFREVLNCGIDREFYGVYETELTFENSAENRYFMEFNGECAWSVLSTMMQEHEFPYTTLENESRRLNLMIEVYSTEAGQQIAEHILYSDGACMENKTVDYSEFYWDKFDYPTIEELNAKYKTSFSESDFDMDDYHIEGGFGEWKFK